MRGLSFRRVQTAHDVCRNDGGLGGALLRAHLTCEALFVCLPWPPAPVYCLPFVSCGGAAILLSNKVFDGFRAKYKLLYSIRTQNASDDSLNCVIVSPTFHN